MEQTSTQRRELGELVDFVKSEERDAAWIARRIGKNYQWVRRRLRGVTPLREGDRKLIESAFEKRAA